MRVAEVDSCGAQRVVQPRAARRAGLSSISPVHEGARLLTLQRLMHTRCSPLVQAGLLRGVYVVSDDACLYAGGRRIGSAERSRRAVWGAAPCRALLPPASCCRSLQAPEVVQGKH